MPDRNHGRQPQYDSNEGGLPDGAEALRAEVDTVSRMVSDIAEYLQPSYPAESLLQLSMHFETISKQFASFAGVKSNLFYELIHRSKSRLSAVNSIAKEARGIALLFEKYARTPGRFSAANSRMQIHRLQSVLENLKAALPPGKTEP